MLLYLWYLPGVTLCGPYTWFQNTCTCINSMTFAFIVYYSDGSVHDDWSALLYPAGSDIISLYNYLYC